MDKEKIELDDKVRKKLNITINFLEIDSNIQDLDDKVQKIIDILKDINEEYIKTANCKKLKETLIIFYDKLNKNAEKIKK